MDPTQAATMYSNLAEHFNKLSEALSINTVRPPLSIVWTNQQSDRFEFTFLGQRARLHFKLANIKGSFFARVNIEPINEDNSVGKPMATVYLDSFGNVCLGDASHFSLAYGDLSDLVTIRNYLLAPFVPEEDDPLPATQSEPSRPRDNNR